MQDAVFCLLFTTVNIIASKAIQPLRFAHAWMYVLKSSVEITRDDAIFMYRNHVTSL